MYIAHTTRRKCVTYSCDIPRLETRIRVRLRTPRFRSILPDPPPSARVALTPLSVYSAYRASPTLGLVLSVSSPCINRERCDYPLRPSQRTEVTVLSQPRSRSNQSWSIRVTRTREFPSANVTSKGCSNGQSCHQVSAFIR